MPDTHPSRDLAAYAGTYQNPVYGDAQITFQDGKLNLHFHSIETGLDHFQYDTFVVNFEAKTRLTFCLDDAGNVVKFTVVGLEFKKVAPAAPEK